MPTSPECGIYAGIAQPVPYVHRAAVLEGRLVANAWQEELAAEVRVIRDRGGRPPGLGVILVGNRPDSNLYVARKKEACDKVKKRGQRASRPGVVGKRMQETLHDIWWDVFILL
jgi:5,10-methylene-tetrahydrofolate dehydrogenase/methenyl tetrahydrofolate cyclohydrolase